MQYRYGDCCTTRAWKVFILFEGIEKCIVVYPKYLCKNQYSFGHPPAMAVM